MIITPSNTKFRNVSLGYGAPYRSSRSTKLPSLKEGKRQSILKAKKQSRDPAFGSKQEDDLLLFFSSFQIKNKKIQNITLAPNSTRIQKGLDILEQMGVIPEEEFKIEPNQLAEKFLFGINCTLSDESRNFSLTPGQTDKEEIENINILDKKEYTNIRPAFIKVPDKFPNEQDPFYNIDERRTEKEKNIKNQLLKGRKPYLLRIASNTSSMNLGSKKIHRLRYFKDIEELKRRGKF